MSGNQLPKIVETIQAAKTIVLATHVFPDGDALGSLIGLTHILEGLGKKISKRGCHAAQVESA